MDELTEFTNPTMHLSHTPQCTIQNRNVHISVLNGALWDMGQVHYGICKTDLLEQLKKNKAQTMMCIFLSIHST